MAEVDTSPLNSEALGTVGNEEQQADDNVKEEKGTEEPKSDGLDGEKDTQNDNADKSEAVAGEEATEESTAARKSPEGSQLVADDNQEPKNDNSAADNSGEATLGQEGEGVEGGGGEGGGGGKEGGEEGKGGGGEVGGDGEKEERVEEGVKEEGEEDASAKNDELGDGEHQPPPTPTFDSDEEAPAVTDDQNKDTTGETRGLTEGADVVAAGGEDASSVAQPEEGAKTQPLTRSPTRTTDLTIVVDDKRINNTPLGGVMPSLKPHTAELPPVARGQVRGQQMTSAISDALRHSAHPAPKGLMRSRRPPKYVSLATVTVSPARTRSIPHGPSLYYEEPKRPKKVITWEEATNARPPLRIDMEGPTPCSYTPRIKPLNETNAPAFTFGSKCQPEKPGGSRTSWTKSWFQSPHVWTNKVDFTRDHVWPSPNHYPKGPALGPRQRTMPEAPSYTFGHKTAYNMVKPGAAKEPSPNEYKRQLADSLVLNRAPSFTHQFRRDGTQLWGSSELTPGPAAYNPHKMFPERPSYTIQGIRREKSHVLGPYSSF